MALLLMVCRRRKCGVPEYGSVGYSEVRVQSSEIRAAPVRKRVGLFFTLFFWCIEISAVNTLIDVSAESVKSVDCFFFTGC